MKLSTEKTNLFKVLVVAVLALPMILGPWAFSQQPVKITGQPVSVSIASGAGGTNSVAVSNAVGTVLATREQGITTNAIAGGSSGITNFPASLSQTNSSGVLKTDPSNSTNITVNLPSGAAISSLQTALNTIAANILAQLAAGLAVTNSASANPVAVTNAIGTNLAVNVVTSALPSGAATSSLQTAGNNQLASILAQLAAGLATTGTVTATQANIFSNNINQVGGVDVGTSVPVTNGPLILKHIITTASTNTNLIKSGAGVLYFVHPMNVTSTAFNIHIFDRASQPVTNSTRLLQVQAAVLGSGGGLHSDYQPMGIPFSNGLAIATSTTSSETNLIAISANNGIDIGYK